MGHIIVDRWWQILPKESKELAFMLVRECSLKETERCMAKKYEVTFDYID